ncbi:hypothetical protein QWY86_16060 [Pedobacter aquatilis]|uniref:alpha/beta fold hydrolase n=1 Tax=Pedobacter aquatilis TaxID=351343 RepID=UPI0025B4ACB0|nr:hypothetical protein [Pedobacter aquatilis]MDN3588199.1 hypothetical protein [Pedobacter aquatilis]
MDTYEIHFNKAAREVDPEQFKAFINALKANDYTDLIVLSHGWNNNIEDARKLYEGLLEKISKAINAKGKDGKRFASLNVFWPSKQFTDRELIPGNAASMGDLDEQETQQLALSWAGIQDVFDEPAETETFEKILLAIQQNGDEDILAREFSKLLKITRPEQENSPFESLKEDDVKTFLQDGSIPYLETQSTDGGAASIADPATQAGQAMGLFSGLKQGVANLMNLATYYKMKNRAGEIGAALNLKLSEIKKISPAINFHLVGHSFGARLVTSALSGPEQIKAKTLALIQAAFSHYAFASKYDEQNDGFFRSVLTENKVSGALLITHTRADRAVGLAYALASRLGGQQASDIGDKDSLYGGLGGNGAQKTPGISNSIALKQAAETNHFQAGKTYNLLSDNIIGGHSDIIKDEVGSALVNAFYL